MEWKGSEAFRCPFHNCVLCYPQKPGIKPEGVDLCGALVDWTTERSSRKNVFQVGNLLLTTMGGKKGRDGRASFEPN